MMMFCLWNCVDIFWLVFFNWLMDFIICIVKEEYDGYYKNWMVWFKSG